MTLLIMFASAEIGKKILREIDFGKLLGKSVLFKILVWLVIHCSYLILAFRFWWHAEKGTVVKSGILFNFPFSDRMSMTCEGNLAGLQSPFLIASV